MIDVQALKTQVNLLELASRATALRRVASSGGGEWAGPCPFCGGRDRFHVQPYYPGGGRWLCRGCTQGAWRDAIAYGQRLYPGLGFQEVCQRLGEGQQINAYSRSTPVRPVPQHPAYHPPAAAWQDAARQAVQTCERLLWGGEGGLALNYLRRRGLRDDTIRYWRLGFSPGMKLNPLVPHPSAQKTSDFPSPASGRGEVAGLYRQGEGSGGVGDLYLPRGVLIPCLALGEVWYLKIALLPGERVKCQGCGEITPARQPCPKCGTINKYRGVKGNRTGAIFGADELRGAGLALFVEGEFDAMLAWQALNDVIAVCTLGAASNRPDLATWGPYLLPLERILALYDADRAGQAGLQALQELSERVEAVQLPAGAKDVNDYLLQGGDLWLWLKGVVEELGLLGE
jgi:DNA primase